jgi:peroxiredoxin
VSAGCAKKEESVGMKFDVGKPAPEFALQDLQGNTIELSSMKGKVLIIDFWATWCGPCKQEVPNLVSLQAKYRDKGLQIVGLSLDQGGASEVKPFADEHDVNYTMLIADEKTARAYGGVSMIPTTFVVDRNGVVVKRFLGYTTPEAFEEAILPLLGTAS